MCRGEAAVLEHSVKLLREDQGVWTERVSAECPLPEADDGLHLAHAGALKRFTHLFHTAAGEMR